ncbi:MAG: hypothetical protein WC421_09270 [Elusimicrobiales bacterium]
MKIAMIVIMSACVSAARAAEAPRGFSGSFQCHTEKGGLLGDREAFSFSLSGGKLSAGKDGMSMDVRNMDGGGAPAMAVFNSKTGAVSSDGGNLVITMDEGGVRGRLTLYKSSAYRLGKVAIQTQNVTFGGKFSSRVYCKVKRVQSSGADSSPSGCLPQEDGEPSQPSPLDLQDEMQDFPSYGQ